MNKTKKSFTTVQFRPHMTPFPGRTLMSTTWNSDQTTEMTAENGMRLLTNISVPYVGRPIRSVAPRSSRVINVWLGFEKGESTFWQIAFLTFSKMSFLCYKLKVSTVEPVTLPFLKHFVRIIVAWQLRWRRRRRCSGSRVTFCWWPAVAYLGRPVGAVLPGALDSRVVFAESTWPAAGVPSVRDSPWHRLYWCCCRGSPLRGRCSRWWRCCCCLFEMLVALPPSWIRPVAHRRHQIYLGSSVCITDAGKCIHTYSDRDRWWWFLGLMFHHRLYVRVTESAFGGSFLLCSKVCKCGWVGGSRLRKTNTLKRMERNIVALYTKNKKKQAKIVNRFLVRQRAAFSVWKMGKKLLSER